MSQSKQITTPTETIHLPAPSWNPAIFALGLLGLTAGQFATGYIFPTWYYTVAGAILVLVSLRSMIKNGRRDFYSLPREQEDVRAALPADSFRLPARDN